MKLGETVREEPEAAVPEVNEALEVPALRGGRPCSPAPCG